MTNKGHLIIIGASARAAAQSAIRAGYSPWCIDLFADRDLQAIAPVKRCPRDQWPHGILELMKDAPPGPVMFTGAMENHLDVIDHLMKNRSLLCHPGEEAGVLRSRIQRIREPSFVQEAVNRAILSQSFKLCMNDIPRCPRVYENMSWGARMLWRWLPQRRRRQLLVKPRRGSGGKGVRLWSKGSRLNRSEYLQDFISGMRISGIYVAIDDVATLVGVTEQLIGDQHFGADGFEYVGNIGPIQLGAAALGQLRFLGTALHWAVPMHGIFGLDAILSPADDTPAEEIAATKVLRERVFPVEVNPRYVASVEIIERAGDASILTGLLRRTSPEFPMASRNGQQFGKAVVRAMCRCRVGDLCARLPPGQIADIPQLGELLEKGDPVCTVFAEGSTRDACYAGLRDMAQKVYTRLHPA